MFSKNVLLFWSSSLQWRRETPGAQTLISVLQIRDPFHVWHTLRKSAGGRKSENQCPRPSLQSLASFFQVLNDQRITQQKHFLLARWKSTYTTGQIFSTLLLMSTPYLTVCRGPCSAVALLTLEVACVGHTPLLSGRRGVLRKSFTPQYAPEGSEEVLGFRIKLHKTNGCKWPFPFLPMP